MPTPDQLQLLRNIAANPDPAGVLRGQRLVDMARFNPQMAANLILGAQGAPQLSNSPGRVPEIPALTKPAVPVSRYNDIQNIGTSEMGIAGSMPSNQARFGLTPRFRYKAANEK